MNITNPLTKLFLKRRNYNEQYFTDIYNPNHQPLQNIDKITTILKQIHDNYDQIVIMPDFDTDGISAATVGYAGLAELGFNVKLYTPNAGNGYGINVSDIKKVQAQFPDTKYIITCDVGITCYDAFKYAYEQGLKVLITDHHEEEKDENKPMPLACEVIVNPCQLSETYKLRQICGAYVFWQVIYYYMKAYEPAKESQINRLRVFAGIGTIGDMMPLINENRRLIIDMVNILKMVYNNNDSSIVDNLPGCQIYRTAFQGLFTLLSAEKENGSLRSPDDLNEKYIGWTLGPTYNSAKRMDFPMSKVFSIFTSTNPKIRLQDSRELIANNEKRKVVTKEYSEELEEETENHLQPYAPYIYLTDAPGGIVGLLANEFMQKNKVPTFVINKNTYSGSGRSYPYFPVVTALAGSGFNAKGHNEAFGISFKNADQVKLFYDQLLDNITPLVKNAAKEIKQDYDILLTSEPIPKFQADGIVNSAECIGFYHDLELLHPYGQGFPEPRIAIVFPTKATELTTMGHEKQHLKATLANGLQLISWNHAELEPEILGQEYGVFIGNFSVNSFGGVNSLQMIGKFKPVSEKEPAHE